MIKSSTSRRDAHSARVMLRMIKRRRHANSEGARVRVAAMMADLDVVLLHLPEDPSDEIIQEIERVVVTLRTADECLGEGNAASGMQALDLAKARLDRLAAQLMGTDDEAGSEPDQEAAEEPGEEPEEPDVDAT